MRIFTKYIADDGTEFRDRDECIEYEAKMAVRDINHCVWVFGDQKQLLNLATCDWSDIWYVWFAGNSQAAEKFEQMWGERCGGDCPISKNYCPLGLHMYHEAGNDWYFVPELIDDMNDLVASCKEKIVKEMKNV